MNNPVFIIGCGRSGTSLLQSMLNSHKNIAIPGETHYFPSLIKFLKVNKNKNLQYKKLETYNIIAENITFSQLNITKQALFKYLTNSNVKKIDKIVGAANIVYAQNQGKNRWGEKTPDYILHLDLIKEIFPNAYLIHIIRDGRDVAISYFKNVDDKYLFGPKTSIEAAKYWKKRVIAGRLNGMEFFGDKYIETRYEDLLVNSEKELKRICNYLQEDYDQNMMNYKQSALSIYSKELLHHRNLKNDIMTNNSMKWREGLKKKDLFIFNQLAGKLLEELGYEKSSSFSLRAIIELLLYSFTSFEIGLKNYIRKRINNSKRNLINIL